VGDRHAGFRFLLAFLEMSYAGLPASMGKPHTVHFSYDAEPFPDQSSPRHDRPH